MSKLFSTRQVSKMLNVNIGMLSREVWLEKFPPPEKSPSGHYLWTEADIRSAAKYFFVPRKKIDAFFKDGDHAEE